MPPLTKRRILLIDDQESIHDDYRKIICARPSESPDLAEAEAELFGDVQIENDSFDQYEVDSAFNGEDAITLVEKALSEGRPYAVAFVDIRMPPGLDGVKTVRRIWEIDSEVLVVLCSAYSDYTWEEIGRELGRTDRFLILRKPFDNIEVRQCAAALAVRWTIARTDPLTGLLNRRSFEEHLRREWAYAVRNDRPLSCVMIDADYFKSINDRCGHAAGDQALSLLAKSIAAETRPGDVLCRYGGEEFCVLLPGAHEAAAAAWAERVRRAIASRPLVVGADDIHLTASLGVVERGCLTQEEFLNLADNALREAKSAGRNRVKVWHTEAADHTIQRIQKYADLFVEVTARDVMTTSTSSLRCDTVVAEAANFLLCRHMSSTPVTHPDGTLAGMVGERDIMEALGVNDGWNSTIDRFMSPRVIQYNAETPAAVIFEFLCRVQIDRVVIAQDQRPIGLISRGTFLRWMQNCVRALGTSYAEKNARPQLLQTADELTRHAHHLQEELHSATDELLAPVVASVSAMQDIMAELLSWAQCSQVKPPAEKSARES